MSNLTPSSNKGRVAQSVVVILVAIAVLLAITGFMGGNLLIGSIFSAVAVLLAVGGYFAVRDIGRREL
ncbi:putative integral membrane protein [Clavibacter sepedonicus]|uniref:Integral membrane protein n=1 Tax=Clavibacter sepedonicus TaxID=31964 RepID=B0RHA2_CLASE|nr:putative integral membrane protein [Clavibacter sepedonicus]